MKSIANWRPTLPPVTRAEQHEDQARDGDQQGEREEVVALPDDVKHVRAPLLEGAAAGWSGGPGTPPRSPRNRDALRAHGWATTIRAQGPGDGDRGEHRDEHADDQHEAEAADRRGSEQEQDRRGDQARHVGVEDRVPGPVEAGLDRRRQGLAEPQLLLRPLEDQDVGVHRHAHREHEARDARPGSW